MFSTLKIKRSFLIFIILFIFLNNLCFALKENPLYVRILILAEKNRFNIRIKGAFKLIDFKTDEVLFKGKDLNTTIFLSKQGLIFIKDRSYSIDKILIEPKSNLFELERRKYRGKILIVKENNLKFSVINFVPLEDYIKGILHREASKRWPIEALKAQAVVSRTYALYTMENRKKFDYDLGKDIYSQVYGGVFAERFRTNLAVDLTKGKVLTYEGKIFPTYFHSTCGGHTEDASLLWNIDIMPLKGVTCNFCKNSPHFYWQSVLELEKMEKLLSPFIKDGHIKDIVVVSNTESGRIYQLKIITHDGREIPISAKDFRNTVGPNLIRSTNFTLKILGDKVYFEGIGWGHGVGFCQWGGYFMAKKGYRYKDILKYYFPGSEISDLDKLGYVSDITSR
jgi:stage II sporulation protein D